MNVSGCMFCKNAEGKKINQKMKKNKLMLRCGKGEKFQMQKKNRKLKPPKYSSLYT
jgi:hypothetical protein